MKKGTKFATLLKVAVFCLAIPMLCANANQSFDDIRAQADSSHTPLIVVYAPENCHYCDTLRQQVESNGTYRAWRDGKEYLDFWSADDVLVKNFTQNNSGLYPFVAVYWNRGGDDTLLCEKFTGRSGSMLVKSGTLAEQFMRSVEFAIFKNKASCTNDAFADAAPFDTGGVSFGCNDKATVEDGEPLVRTWGDATATVWWKWTASENGIVTFDTIGSEFDTVMGVYTGETLADLAFVAEDDDGAETNNASRIEFSAVSGTSYYIAVAGCSGATGNITLNKHFSPLLTEIVGNYTWTYRIINDKAEICNGGNVAVYPMPEGDLSIPASLGGAVVSRIGDYALHGCENLYSVTIPDSVKSIGAYAFQYCDGIEKIDWGEGVEEISQWAFSYCNKLKDVTFTNGLKSVAQYAFGYCDALNTITLPRSMEDVKWGAFASDPALVTAYFHSSFKGKGSSGMFEDSPNVAIRYYNCMIPIAPPPVENLSATTDGPRAVRLDWDGDASYEVSCYKIYRSESEVFEDAELIAEVMPDEETVFFDGDVSPDPIYCYWVVAANDIFESEPAGPVFGCCEDYFCIDENTKLPIGFVAENYEFQLKAIFDNGHLSWGIDEMDYGDGWIESLPEGMSLSSDGLISGVPVTAGTYNLWINLCDVRFPDSGSSLVAPLTLVVREKGKPCITGSSPEGFAPVVLQDGESQLFSVEATDFAGDNLTYSWVVDGVEVQSGTKSAYRLRTNGDKPGAIREVVCFANNDNSSGEMLRKWIVKIPAETLYVNAATGDDTHDGLTKETALASIQAAIDKAVDGDTIIVADGVYAPISTMNLSITIESENGYKAAIIDGGGENGCANLGGPEANERDYDENGKICVPYYGGSSNGRNTILKGFTIRNGKSIYGAGVTDGTVEQCLIIGNVAEASPNFATAGGIGGGAYGSLLRYCTIVDNSAIGWNDDENIGNGIDGEGGGACGCTLKSCIVWNNSADVDADCSNCETTECIIDVNPLFADAQNGDWRVTINSPAVVDGVVVAGCDAEIAKSTIPDLSQQEIEQWVVNTLAPRYAKGDETAEGYRERFAAKYGSDATTAFFMTTGKNDAQGNDMYVWQDYVAGTDPLDTNSVFTATITMVNGAPVVEWSPKLSAAEEAKRRYTIYGKASLDVGEEWHSPTNALDRFFMVGVEMAD